MQLWWQPLRRSDGRLVWLVVCAKDWFLAREALTALTGTEADPCTATGWRESELAPLLIFAELVQLVVSKSEPAK